MEKDELIKSIRESLDWLSQVNRYSFVANDERNVGDEAESCFGAFEKLLDSLAAELEAVKGENSKIKDILRFLQLRPIATWYDAPNHKNGGYYAGWDDAEYRINKALEGELDEWRSPEHHEVRHQLREAIMHLLHAGFSKDDAVIEEMEKALGEESQ